MSKPHKHAAVIKAWADGAKIQSAHPTKLTRDDPLGLLQPELVWIDIKGPAPVFFPEMLYRVKPEPLEWQAERDAHARGEDIEASFDAGKTWWTVIGTHSFRSAGYQYRIKPKPHKWQKEREAFERGERIQWRSLCAQHATVGWLDVPKNSPLMGLAFDEPTNEFRIPHKWQAEMDAWERGEAVECRGQYLGSAWTEMARSGNPHMQPAWMESLEYRIKPKAVKNRIRVAAMGEPDGSGKVWTWAVYTDDHAAETERQAAFLCWLHDWKEIERPAPEVPKVPPGVYLNGKSMSWVGIDHASGPCQTGWWTVGIDSNGMMTPVRCDGPWKR